MNKKERYEAVKAGAKIFRIFNSAKNLWWEGIADNFIDVLNSLGWPKENCIIKQYTKNGGWSLIK